MADMMYPFGFILSLIGLSLWFYFHENEKLSRFFNILFLGGFSAYVFSLIFSVGTFDYKLFTAFRDMVVMSLMSWFLSLFKKHKPLYFILFAVAYLLLYSFYFTKLTATFPQKLSKDISLDKNGELLIEVNEEHKIAELDAILSKYKLTATRAFYPADENSTELDDYYVVNLPDDPDLFYEIKEVLSKSDLIDWVEENELVQVDPNEVGDFAKAKKKYDVNDPGLINLWGFDEMEVDELYKFLKKEKIKPKKKSLIAILDTGIDAKHEDIIDNYKSIQEKYDNDPKSHGTHCAGIAAAVSNNSLGIASFSPDNRFVEVTSIKVLSASGMGTQKTIIDGILEAADNNVDVISMSLGGRSSQLKQRAYVKAVEYANKKGAIVIAAAGNNNGNARNISPANTKGIVVVSAVDTVLRKASFSNYVRDIKMGIAAPGVSIYSTIPNNGYANYNGTSMATPYVAGLAGLMKSLKPDLTTKEFYEIINKTGIETRDTKNTGRLIQPGDAVIELLRK